MRIAGCTVLLWVSTVVGFSPSRPTGRTAFFRRYAGKDWEGRNEGSGASPGWKADEGSPDWESEDGSLWSTFESAADEKSAGTAAPDVEDDTESWLDRLQSLTAEEVEYNAKEADRADKARQMEEWGFNSETIANTLDVATDTKLEDADDVEGMKLYREESYIDTVDLETVESHTTVDLDEETKEPVRSQMVYVDEHSCIGCTNCAMIAQSTFFMHSEHGRARVFQQWGDDEETIQIAIETCPVDVGINRGVLRVASHSQPMALAPVYSLHSVRRTRGVRN